MICYSTMKKRVIFSGGIGNQMFQYAFTLSMKAKGINVVPVLDLYKVNRMHNGYMLGRAFGIKDQEQNDNRLSELVTRFIYKYKPHFITYNENPSVFSSDVFCSNSLFYNGCWIDPRYFKGIEDIVRKAFVFINIDENNYNLANEMTTTTSISLHIRRGDYLSSNGFDVCSSSYYNKCINYFCNIFTTPCFYVFSDDILWSQNLMNSFNVKYKIIDFNRGEDSYKDIFLMSKCKHNIIANSTFSWWGAWLNNNKSKIVLCPNVWIKTRYNVPYPESWNKIDV